MTTTKLELLYRPVKLGFLTRKGNLKDLINAVGVNTLLLGGITNPIIPFNNDFSIIKQYISTFNIDFVVPISNFPGLEKLDASFRIYELFRHNPPLPFSDICTYLLREFFDISNAVDLHSENETDARQGGFKLDYSFMLPKWQRNDPLANLFSVYFGYIIEPKSYRFSIQQYLLENLNMEIVNFKPKLNFISYGKLKIFPLFLSGLYRFTREQIAVGKYFPDSNAKGIFVGDNNSIDDLVLFWNLRAAGYVDHFFDVNDNRGWFDYILSLYDMEYIFWYFKHNNARIYSNRRIQKIPKAIISHYKDAEITRCNGSYPFDVPVKHSFFNKRQEVDASVEYYHDQPHIRFKANDFPIKFQTHRDQFRNKLKNIAIHVNPNSSKFGFGEYILNPPNSSELDTFYTNAFANGMRLIRSEYSGITTYIHSSFKDEKGPEIYLRPLSCKKLIRHILEFSGCSDVHESDPGLLTNRIINHLGGIHDVAVFKIPGVRKLLKNKDYLFSLQQAKNLIMDGGSFKEWKMKKVIVNEDLSHPHRVLEFLMLRNIFRYGYELKCPSCNMTTWINLDKIDYKWQCSKCWATNDIGLDVGGIDENDKLIKCRKYRRSGIFSWHGQTKGIIPVLLASQFFELDSLRSMWDRFHVETSTEFNIIGKQYKNGIKKQEIDFIVQYNSQGGDYSIAIGECKDGAPFKVKDFQKLKRIWKLISKIGFDVYVILVKLDGVFNNYEQNQINKWIDDEMPLIILTNDELEAINDPYEKCKLDEVSLSPPARNLEDFVRNTSLIYKK